MLCSFVLKADRATTNISGVTSPDGLFYCLFESVRTCHSLSLASSADTACQPLPSSTHATRSWLSTKGTTSSSNSWRTCREQWVCQKFSAWIQPATQPSECVSRVCKQPCGVQHMVRRST